MGLYQVNFCCHCTLNGIFYAIQKYGTDQTIVQRYLIAKSHKEAIKASFVNVLFCVPIWMLFMFVGSMLFSFYELSEFTLPEAIRADSVFPHFITTQLPIGVTGLILAGLVAAALSSLDSDLNSLSAVGVEDFYKRAFPDKSDKHYLFVGRMIVLVCGIASLAIAVIYVEAEGETVLGIVFALYAVFFRRDCRFIPSWNFFKKDKQTRIICWHCRLYIIHRMGYVNIPAGRGCK